LDTQTVSTTTLGTTYYGKKMVEQRKTRLPRGTLAGTKTTMLEKKRKYEMGITYVKKE